MKVISVSSKTFDCDECRLLRASCQRFNVSVDVFTCENFDWEGRAALNVLRLQLALMPHDEIVLLTDLWDTFVCCGLDEIERKYLAFDSPIVFGCEVGSGEIGDRAFPMSPYGRGLGQSLSHLAPVRLRAA